MRKFKNLAIFILFANLFMMKQIDGIYAQEEGRPEEAEIQVEDLSQIQRGESSSVEEDGTQELNNQRPAMEIIVEEQENEGSTEEGNRGEVNTADPISHERIQGDFQTKEELIDFFSQNQPQERDNDEAIRQIIIHAQENQSYPTQNASHSSSGNSERNADGEGPSLEEGISKGLLGKLSLFEKLAILGGVLFLILINWLWISIKNKKKKSNYY